MSVPEIEVSQAQPLHASGGATFVDITGDLPNATGVCKSDAWRSVCGRWKPSALLVLPYPKDPSIAIVLAGTVSGVYATAVGKKDAAAGVVGKPSGWSRLGGCKDLPLVLVGGLSYEEATGTVVAATMGRGVYVLPNAAQVAADALKL